MEKLRGIVDKILAWFSIIILALMSVLVVYQVVTRYVFRSPSSWSESVVTYGFIWLTMICGAYVFGKREHMAMTFVLDKFRGRTKIVVEMINELIVSVFSLGVLGVGGYLGAVKQMSQADSILPISMGVIYICLPLSAAAVIFYFVCNEMALARNFREGR